MLARLWGSGLPSCPRSEDILQAGRADQGTKLRVTLGLSCCFVLIAEAMLGQFECTDRQTPDGSNVQETPGDEGSTWELLGLQAVARLPLRKSGLGREGWGAGSQDPRRLWPGRWCTLKPKLLVGGA